METTTGGEFEVIASTDDIDRHGEVIVQDGWKLEKYWKNPVILVDHWYSVDKIVGKATDIRIEGGKMIIRGVFADTPRAQEVQKLYDAGFLRAVSVGFIPLQRDENNRDIITSAELLELSFVPVPSNPEALDNLKKLGIDTDFWVQRKSLEMEAIEAIQKETAKNGENLTKLLQEISEIKTLVVNGKTISDAQTEQKELVQSAARALNEALRGFKRA